MSYEHARTSESSITRSPMLRQSPTRHSIESISSSSSLKALEATEGPDAAGPSRPMHRRSSTLSSIVIPLTLSLSEVEERGEPTTERTVGLAAGECFKICSAGTPSSNSYMPELCDSCCFGCGIPNRFRDFVRAVHLASGDAKSNETVCLISSAPGVVVADVKSVGAALTVWAISGILAWTGARYLFPIRLTV